MEIAKGYYESVNVSVYEPAYQDLFEQAVVVPDSTETAFYFLTTPQIDKLKTLPDCVARKIVVLSRVNGVPELNQYFEAINRCLVKGGIFVGCIVTAEQLKQFVFASLPFYLAWPYYTLLFFFKRVFPKLKITRNLYRRLFVGRPHVISKAELLGRLVYCGFKVVDLRESSGELFFVVEKVESPSIVEEIPQGLIIRLNRVGQGGKRIQFYKMRTMHPYSQYLQSHIYSMYSLQLNGKFNNDFRVTTWGKYLRRIWVDEIPMLYNWIRGDLKLVGVRPLTEHYLSLYPPELLQKRLKYKPGLIPPFYADLPVGLDEIIASEERYLNAYEQHPFRTDITYLLRVIYNILVKRARSQ